MPRPLRRRFVGRLPVSSYFKPGGVPLSQLDEVVLTIDELEAIRLADFEGMYHEQAAERMKVSRQTFGRIVGSAHRKIADALVEGKALRVNGGEYEVPDMRTFQCSDCARTWQVPHGAGRPSGCPSCVSQNFHRAEQGRPFGRRGGRGWRRGGRGPVSKQKGDN